MNTYREEFNNLLHNLYGEYKRLRREVEDIEDQLDEKQFSLVKSNIKYTMDLLLGVYKDITLKKIGERTVRALEIVPTEIEKLKQIIE